MSRNALRKLDELCDLHNIAKAMGLSAYVINNQLLVWVNGGYEEITSQEQLEDLCR